jgi:molybdenum cofactor cytidylyltransferase
VPECAIIILAAGGSTRMGTPKQSLEIQGSTLLRRAVATALASICRPVCVVLGAGAETLSRQLTNLPVTVVINQNWENGIGTSIRQGVATIAASGVDAVMIFLCDQPLITAASLDLMVGAFFESGRQICAAAYAAALGTPAIFSAELFDELRDLPDAHGGKAIIQRHADQVLAFPLPQAETDLDTMEDVRRLRV